MRRAIAALVAVAGVALTACQPPSPPAGQFQGPAYAGGGASAPSGSKPESKLWFNDGQWWGVLFDGTRAEHTIWRLNRADQKWANTGVLVDARDTSRADTLWDGAHLYVASHRFAEAAVAGSPSTVSRYRYDSGTDTYALDFQDVVNDYRTETLVLAKESTSERLWATWTQDNQVMVANTTAGDRTWSVPAPLPVPEAVGLAADDIASVIAFGGDQIGVMWSNQVAEKVYFSVHHEGEPDAAWGASEVAAGGAGMADDHINLKTDATGTVYAVTKTSRSQSTDPLLLLLKRDATPSWATRTVATVADNHTRPIVVLDEQHGRIDVFATVGQSGGDVYRKTSPMAAIAFPAGRGEAVIDETANDINNATTMKGNVSSSTGLVVLATGDTDDLYRHYWNPNS